MNKKNIFKYIIGIDEVGRGPLAGPVSVCAVMWEDTDAVWQQITSIFPSIKDSKKLTPKKRFEWFQSITNLAKKGIMWHAFNSESNVSIDDNGITQSIQKAVTRCLKQLAVNPQETKILLDGGLRAPSVYFHQETIIRGDEQELPIALASIVAKINRDRYMEEQEQLYPNYSFASHKGYGTKQHIDEIQKYGLSSLHRKTFCAKVTRI